MKAYPLTEDQISNLGQLGVATTAAFSVATGFLGFAVSLSKDLAFANGVPEAVIKTWEFYRTAGIVGAAVIYLIGIALYLKGQVALDRIKRNTTFAPGVEPYKPLEWPTWAFRIAAVLAVFAIGAVIGKFVVG